MISDFQFKRISKKKLGFFKINLYIKTTTLYFYIFIFLHITIKIGLLALKILIFTLFYNLLFAFQFITLW